MGVHLVIMHGRTNITIILSGHYPTTYNLTYKTPAVYIHLVILAELISIRLHRRGQRTEGVNVRR